MPTIVCCFQKRLEIATHSESCLLLKSPKGLQAHGMPTCVALHMMSACRSDVHRLLCRVS